MGWETIAIAGFQALSAVNTMNQGEANAKAIVQQGEEQAKASADNTVRGAGKLQTSFLQSGLTLEGGPMDVLTKAFASGQTDISRIATNADNAAKTAMNTARTAALTSLAKGATGAFGTPGGGGTVGGTIDDLGQKIGSVFDPSPTGPYLSPFTTQFYR